MDKTSTPTDLISPEAAVALWRELRPDAPETAVALYRRAKRGGIPYHLDGEPPTGRVRYSAPELTRWLLGPRALLALRILAVIETADAFGLEVSPCPGGDCVTIFDSDATLYPESDDGPSDLDGAEEWLREEAERRAGS